MTSREKCDYLKKVRKAIADKLGIDLHQTECTFTGECSGTCPKCKSEEAKLNTALLKGAAIVGMSAVLTTSFVGCTPISGETEPTVEPPTTETDLSGAVEEPSTTETEPSSAVKEPPSDDYQLSGEVAYPPEEYPVELSGDVAY